MDDKDNYILTGSGVDSITVTDTVMVDLDLGAAQPALTSADFSAITLDDLVNTSSISTITLPPSSYTISGGTGIGTSYATNSYSWSQGFTPTVNITQDGVNISDGGDLKIGNKSLKDFITKMEQRLSILVPDPEKLEKFEALRKAYEHYKTMEALCFPEDKDKIE